MTGSQQKPWIKVRDAPDSVGQSVELRGWIYQKRLHGKIGFINLRDGTGFIQIAVKRNNVGDEAFKAFSDAFREASVTITGEVKEDERAPGGYEVTATALTIVHPSHPEIDQEVAADSAVDLMLDKRHLVIRGEKTSAILKVRAEVMKYFREFMDKRGVTELTPPTLVSTFCEGGSSLFKVAYFDKEIFLTQSSQLYLESGIFAFGDVYCLLPSYRAEKSRTRRHVTEYTHLEVELAFADFEDNNKFIEDMVIFVVEKARKHLRHYLEMFDVWELRQIPQRPFMRITYEDAAKWLKEQGVEVAGDGDITDLHERTMTEHHKVPILLTHFPRGIKPFYHKVNPDDPDVTQSTDLLLPTIGEVIGAGERETDLDSMLERMEAEDVPMDSYYWYTDLRKYGSVPHSGFGLGIERFVQWLLNLDHIRDTIMYPRTIGRVSP